MSDEKPGELGVVGGILAMLAGAPILAARMGEEQHTVCADCTQHGPARTLGPGYVNCAYANLVWRVEDLEREPPWAGCRGFKLREGAPGPQKRYTDSMKEKLRKGIIPAEQAAFPKEEKP